MSLETIRADFDRLARLLAEEPERPERYESFLLAQIPVRCRRVLEVGCGTGRLARAIADRGTAVTAVDASPEMIRLARNRSSGAASIEFACGDFSDLPFDPGSYDGVVSVATLHHMSFPEAVARMKRLVAPGGVFVLHDLRSPTGAGDWLASGVAAVLNGDAGWWIRARVGARRAVRAAWREHGARERYLTIAEVRALCATALPGARIHRHPLWRYTVVWTDGLASPAATTAE